LGQPKLTKPTLGMCAVFILCGIGKIGRRDWTRTNDPHHVKEESHILTNFYELSFPRKAHKH